MATSRPGRSALTIAVALFVVLAVLQLVIVVFNHYNFRTFAYYYGVYNFAFYDFAHFGSNPVPVLFDGRNSTFMQDHFSLLLPLLSPLYWIAKFTTGTYTLLVIQWIAIASGGWATYRFVVLKTSHQIAAIGAMVCYFTLYSRFASYVADCNLAIIGSSLVPVFLYYFEAGRRSLTILFFVLLVIIREDFSLWLAFICLYLVIAHRHDPAMKRFAAMLAIVSVSAFILIMTVVIPALETDSVKFLLFNYSALGSNSGEAIVHVLTHPLDAVRLLFVNHLDDAAYDGIKIQYYVVFALSGGILLLLRPALLLCFVPIVAKKMFNDDPIRWGIESYYGIETVSLMPALVFSIIGRWPSIRISNAAALLVVASSLTVTAYCFSNTDQIHVAAKSAFYKPSYWQPDQPTESLHAALRSVPEEAAVSATGRILTHVAFRKKIYYFPAVNDAEYLCINIWGDAWPLREDQFQQQLDSIRRAGEWEEIYTEGNAAILRKK